MDMVAIFRSCRMEFPVKTVALHSMGISIKTCFGVARHLESRQSTHEANFRHMENFPDEIVGDSEFAVVQNSELQVSHALKPYLQRRTGNIG